MSITDQPFLTRRCIYVDWFQVDLFQVDWFQDKQSHYYII